MPASDNLLLRYLRRLGAGSLLVSVIIHVIVAIVATLYVISSSAEKREAKFQGGGGSNSGPPAAATHSVQMARNQPTLSNLTQRLSVDSPNAAVGLPDLPEMPGVALGGGGPSSGAGIGSSLGAGVGAGTGKGPIMPAFGFRDARSGGSLAGRLYDLKQTPKRAAAPMDLLAYGKVVDEFLSRHWSAEVLNRYYQAPDPIYTTQIFIPVMPADGGPKAFGQEKFVAPKFWLIRYRGRVSPPSGGSWRFWGYAGEVCAVAINGKTVLVANHVDVKTPRTNWKSAEAPGQPAGSGRLVAGDWVDLRAGGFVDIDILIGERGGGTFDCFLLVEKKGDASTKTAAGDPVPLLFRLAPSDTPQAAKAPRFTPESPVWRALPPPQG